jgi:SAM-dependent methyltransferase
MSVRARLSHELHALRGRVQHERGRRAEERQRAYQAEKAQRLVAHIDEMTPDLTTYAELVKARIERVRPVNPEARVLEVGSGAHGLIFFLGLANAVGVDPLADIYPSLFPEWQRRAKTLRAYGEALPFETASFDLVLSDNVIDHAENPDAILAEIARVLRPGGVLYFTVNVHHPIYAAASALHGAWNAAGLRHEITPFADHTVHFTLRGIRARLRALPFRVLHEDPGMDAASADATSPPRHAGDRLKRVFFKNARFEVVAERV